MQYFLISPDVDAAKNLARDEFFLNELRAGDMILYLYVNRNAVIIGRNQNPYRECNLNQLHADGVQLVRRVSGGGAVYHDAGNLNFSFICGKERYSEEEQTKIVLNALRALGLNARVTGRNDMEIEGRKISGNAFCERGGNVQRHGTLLVNANLTVFDRYLHAPKQKLEAKGVKSVRARVGNLADFREGITVETVAEALRESYEEMYGASINPDLSAEDNQKIINLYEKHISWQWQMGETPHFDYTFENRFSFGMGEICLSVENGEVCAARLFTDSLNTALSEETEALLLGCRFEKNALSTRLRAAGGCFAEMGEIIFSHFPAPEDCKIL